MTNETPNQQTTAPGSAGAAPSDPKKTFAGCGAMMAGMMEKHGAGKDEGAPGGETGQQPQDSQKSGCGCGTMMERMLGKYFKGGTGAAGEQH